MNKLIAIALCVGMYVSQPTDDVEILNPYLKIRDGLVLTGDKINFRYMERSDDSCANS